MPYDEQNDRDDLTPTERTAFDQLSRARIPSARLEEATVTALNQRGLLRNSHRSHFGRFVMPSIAAMLVFAAGALVGYEAGVRRADTAQPLAQQATTMPDSLLVQQVAGGRHLAWY